jgi:hypothetical protein
MAQEITPAKYPRETLAKPGKQRRAFSAVCRCNSPEKYFSGEVFLWRRSSLQKYFSREVFPWRSKVFLRRTSEKYFSGEVKYFSGEVFLP